MSLSERIESANARYLAAGHAMQSGVATLMELGDPLATPKHLRVGVNSAMVEHGALTKLLIDKGIFTEVEYLEAIADYMEVEQKRFEAQLSERLGHPVTLA